MDAELRARPLRKPLYEREKAEPPAVVCVTGATGYLAGNVIARLLAAGHTVNATWRGASDETKLAHLKVHPLWRDSGGWGGALANLGSSGGLKSSMGMSRTRILPFG